ncbi:TPA: hypothetical protein HA244_02595 [Candidatus Micrarchaeota archaeon]|nr:hypothetical protein [Candidatus Micrarchaeota archaeon]
MAKILLLCDEHPHETLAVERANQVSEMLKKKGTRLKYYQYPQREITVLCRVRRKSRQQQKSLEGFALDKALHSWEKDEKKAH